MKTYLSSLLLKEQTYFQFPSSPVHQRRNQKSWRIHISGKSMYSLYCSQFQTEFLQWMIIHYGSTYHNCHTELLCDPLEQHHCKDHSQLYSLYNTKLHHQIQFLRICTAPSDQATKRLDKFSLFHCIIVLASILIATFMHLICLAYLSHTCVQRVRNDGDHVPTVLAYICRKALSYPGCTRLKGGLSTQRYLSDTCTSDWKKSKRGSCFILLNVMFCSTHQITDR